MGVLRGFAWHSRLASAVGVCAYVGYGTYRFPRLGRVSPRSTKSVAAADSVRSPIPYEQPTRQLNQPSEKERLSLADRQNSWMPI